MCGALLMLSMPPATMMLLVPAFSWSCANISACMPEPQTLLMVVQPALLGMPAPSAAWRAGACFSPAGSTQPMMTSSTASGATPLRASAARIDSAPSCVAAMPDSAPFMPPIAVRAAPAITTVESSIACLLYACAVAHFKRVQSNPGRHLAISSGRIQESRPFSAERRAHDEPG